MNQNQVVTNNIVMNNYITFDHLNHPHNLQKMPLPGKDVSVDDLMGYFSSKYRNILPHRLNMDLDFKTVLFPFGKTQITELLAQMDILAQLIIQNYLLANTESAKSRSLELLYKIYNKKAFIASYLEHMPNYAIPLSVFKLDPMPKNVSEQHRNKFPNRHPLILPSKPQMSIFQSPIIDLTKLFIDIKEKYESPQEIKELLLYFEPLVQKNWIPVTNDQSIGQASARTKFTHIDDSLLLIGITKFGAKKNELIIQNFLPEKKVSEIKNRYKNLICSRAPDNKIKRWKILQYAPLREEEKLKLQKAVQWLGSADKYHLISRYFLTERSPEFIQAELCGSENLKKKRKKYSSLLLANTLEEPSSAEPLFDLHLHLEENVINQRNYISVPTFNEHPKMQQYQPQQQMMSAQYNKPMELEKSQNKAQAQAQAQTQDQVSEEGFEQESLSFSEGEDEEEEEEEEEEDESDDDEEEDDTESNSHNGDNRGGNNEYRGPTSMVLEDGGDHSFKGGSLKLGDAGNYEIVELDDDSFDKMGTNEETFLEMNSILEMEMNANRVFKKIGSQVYEYEEV